ncbi:hypothetical protein AURDEDRAFT_186462 [Auricularia subglabra TFB-10046 SS5]|nr:hypothetical protein AURDEDRAFT_186462 [Auricularia subglabra TFB-10046 SS5]
MSDSGLTTALPMGVAFLKALTVQLQHYDIPVYCPPCLLMNIKRLLKDPSNIVPCLQPTCHGFWNAAIVVLTTRRTAVEMDAIRAPLRLNIAQCPNRDSHRDHSVGADVDDLLVEALFLCLHAAFLPGKGNRSIFDPSHPKKSFASKRGLWPLSPSNLMPFGARQSVIMYVRWCCTLQFTGAPACLASLIFGCRSLVLPYLLESPTRQRFVWSLVQMLNMDRARDDFAWPETVSGTYSLPDPVPTWFTAPMERLSLWHAGELISALTNGPDAHPEDLTEIWAGFERPLLSALNVALEVVTRNPEANYLHEEQADSLCHWAVCTQRVCPDIPLHPAAAHLEDEAMPKTIQGHLTLLYQRRACWGPGCNVVAADVGRQLQLCARCKFTQYCSKECQRADWRYEHAPHKGVCPLLRPMVSAHQEGKTPWGRVWSIYRHSDNPEDNHNFLVWLNFTMHTRYDGDPESLVEYFASHNVDDIMIE